MRKKYKQLITHHHMKRVLSAYHIEYEISKQISNSQNAIYLINGKYVMKFILYKYRDEKDILSQYHFENYLKQFVSIPETFLTTQGQPYVTLTIKDTTFMVLVQKYIKGRHIYKKEDIFDDAFTYQLGKTIGMMHRHSKTYYDAYGRFHFDQDKSLIDISWMGDVLGEDGLKTYDDILKKVHAIPKHKHLYHLTHYDIHHFNILKKQDQLYVLDFDDMTYGYVYMDIITAYYAVLDMYSYKNKRFIQTSVLFLKPLLNGYRSEYDNLNELKQYFHTLLMYRIFILIIYVGNEYEHTKENVKAMKAMFEETKMPPHFIDDIFKNLELTK
jgi:Ser/Thr protein kinase RdoA (MazF antagonist)